jgi:beta-phosphoglucomutase-like phosphatase (HAD superfamily)
MKAIIFDCDGTLVDSERLGNEVLVEHVARYVDRPSASWWRTAGPGSPLASPQA